MEDLNFVLYMQRKFNFLHSIPGVPHPTSRELDPPDKRGCNPVDLMPFLNGTARSIDQFLSPRPGMKRPPEGITSGLLSLKEYNNNNNSNSYGGHGYEQCSSRPECPSPPKALHTALHGSPQGGTSPPTMPALLPSMSSLQALLSKLPSVTVPLDDNNGGVPRYPSNGRFEVVTSGSPPILSSHGCDLQRMTTEGEATAAGNVGEDDPHPNFRHVGAKPRYNNNAVFDSFDNFSEFGIQEALENGDSSYTSFLNEICS